MWPFIQWSFDLIGQFIPPSSGYYKFIIIAIKYLTKWVEMILLVSMIGLKITSFLETCIICQFGIPVRIITDNGTSFQN